jgi:trans-2,3-dihydro-3-hydroxyanthranilate isomerase
LTGNALAVVHDADGIDDATMLAFAAETGLSETTFVQSPEAEDADYRNRIWMTTREIPFAGHPSLGTAVAVARVRGDSAVRYVQQTQAGLQPIDVQLSGRAGRAAMLQEPPVFGPELDAARVLGAIGLDASDAVPGLPVQVVSTGAWQIIAPVTPEALGRCSPDPAALAELIREHDALTVYVVGGEPQDGAVRTRAFMYGVGDIAQEDPATGSAAGPLIAYMFRRLRVMELAITQGVEMGRPSRLDAAVAGDRVSISGDVVVLAEGVVEL